MPVEMGAAAQQRGEAANEEEVEATKLFVRMVGSRVGTLTIDGFQQLLLSSANSAVDPSRTTTCADDMNQPLSHYFIATSHNTYVTGNQMTSASSAGMYKRCLLMGCRCLEIDCFDGPDGEPLVYHKHCPEASMKRIKFRDVVEAVNDYGFEASPYPIIISFEMHCSMRHAQTQAVCSVLSL